MLKKSVLGVGTVGEGKYKSRVNNKITPAYAKWQQMMRRVYSMDMLSTHPAYKECSVCDEWHNYQIFAEWFHRYSITGLELDKDILVKSNKAYSPSTCCFVPTEINKLFTSSKRSRGDLSIGVSRKGSRFRSTVSDGRNKGIHLGVFDTPELAFEAYKTAKELLIKVAADKYKEILLPEVYKTLLEYKVEKTD